MNAPESLTGLAFYKVPEVAKILRVSVPTVRRLISEHRLGHVKVRGGDSMILVPAPDLQDYIKRQRTSAVSEGDAQ